MFQYIKEEKISQVGYWNSCSKRTLARRSGQPGVEQRAVGKGVKEEQSAYENAAINPWLWMLSRH